MKLKKLTLIAALAMFSLSGAANAMLPLMLLAMGPMMGGMMGGGMMQGMGGHGESAKGASSAEGHDHAGGKVANSAGGHAASGEHRHDSAAGTPGVVGPTGADRPSVEGVGSGRMKSDDAGHERR